MLAVAVLSAVRSFLSAVKSLLSAERSFLSAVKSLLSAEIFSLLSSRSLSSLLLDLSTPSSKRNYSQAKMR